MRKKALPFFIQEYHRAVYNDPLLLSLKGVVCINKFDNQLTLENSYFCGATQTLSLAFTSCCIKGKAADRSVKDGYTCE
ncbi:hypothetical protein [Enterococcus sp. AZ163]|uniref:hypothetical protein n=1 Tax=Enterococcus sp. AZ163 TaxID=2774638 RepID=UPI003D2BB871